MDPFVIRAYLRSPVIRRGHQTLDALLMSVLGRGDVSDLLRVEADLYYASAGFLVEPGPPLKASFVASMRPERSAHWLDVLRPNTHDGDLKIGLARQREGGNILNGYTAMPASAIEWYATGHGDQVLEVLRDLTCIGKRRAAGYGEVERWVVEPGHLDGLVGHFGEPLRPVPVERWHEGGDWVPMEAAWKAPYWEVRNRTKCFVPQGAT